METHFTLHASGGARGFDVPGSVAGVRGNEGERALSLNRVWKEKKKFIIWVRVRVVQFRYKLLVARY